MLRKARELPDIMLTQCCMGAEEGLLLCLPAAPYSFLFTRIGFKRPLLKQMMVGGVGRLKHRPKRIFHAYQSFRVTWEKDKRPGPFWLFWQRGKEE